MAQRVLTAACAYRVDPEDRGTPGQMRQCHRRLLDQHGMASDRFRHADHSAVSAGVAYQANALPLSRNRTPPPSSSRAGGRRREHAATCSSPGSAPSRARSRSAPVDPVMLEVFNNLFMAIAEQMGVRLENTAHSVNIKERLDFSCALFDPEGNLIANAPHIPVHLGSMGGPSLIDVMPWWVHPDVDGRRRHLHAAEQLRRHRRRHRAVEGRPRFGIARSVAAASRHLGEHQNPERHPRPSGCSAGCPVPWAGSSVRGSGSSAMRGM